MSIPSSRLDVATRHGIRPAFRSSSTIVRCSRASEPWCARASSRSASSFRRSAALGELVQTKRQPLGEASVVDEDDRRAVLLDESQDLGIDRRPDRLGSALGAAVHLLPVCGYGL